MLASLIYQVAEATEAAEPTLKVLPDSDELIFGTIFFFVLFIVLARVIFPRLRAALEKRRTAIQGQLESAERTRRDADELLEQYRKQLADARNEVQRIIEEGKRTADSLRKDLVAKAEEEAQSIVQRARQEVSGERDRAMAELRSTVGDLSIQLASKVIEKELSSKDAHKQLVDKAIAELTKGSRN